ncbi:MAG TPA: hypothetical protein VLD85_03165 [Anaeromyxobacteraceae bacterium]|jgi:hypothetical protein|nr:hypothetical protein [Anaeromyxobacteraceae bacterium]
MSPRNPGALKRQKELARLEKQREKQAEREQRRKEKKERPPGESGVDPDIAGIVPGPQPRPEEEA